MRKMTASLAPLLLAPLLMAALLASPRAVAAPSDAKAPAHARNVILFVGDAGAMTAMMTGATTRETSIGVDAGLERGQCDPSPAHRLASLVEQAKDAGLAAGVVTTARITLPVPASAYAHVSDRDWEVDSRMPEAALAAGCRDIARQLIEFDHHGGLDVALGGGRLAFMSAYQADPPPPDCNRVRSDGRLAFVPAHQADPAPPDCNRVRGDGVDLIARWRSRNPTGQYVWTGPQLTDATAHDTGPLLGLFAPDGMATSGGAPSDPAAADQPSLTDMTVAAIAMLAKHPRGYVLVVHEGGIREARYRGDAAEALRRTNALSDAAAAAAKAASDDTLIVVAADRAGDAPVYAHGPGAQRLHGPLEPAALYATLRDALGLDAAQR